MSVTESTATAPDLLDRYASMLAIRGFEERTERLFASGDIRGSTHLGIGQEAVAVGTRAGLRDDDLVGPTYRGHAWALAWGVPLDEAFGELLGRETGCNRGRGGSKHFASAAHGVLPCNAIVAANLPIACGTAFADRLDGRPRVTVAVFGDGATNQAAFHEALNQAAVWRLPVLFVCENNLYSEMTPIAAMVRVERLADRAAAYGIPGRRVDGMDVVAVEAVIRDAADRARAGEGPSFIEAMTYRFCGHMPGDNEPYRGRDEVERWRERDPLRVARQRLIDGGVSADTIAAVEARVETHLETAQQAALAAPRPAPARIGLGAADWMEWRR